MDRLTKWNTLIHDLVIYCVLCIIIRDFLVFEIRKNLDLRKILVTPKIFLKSRFHCISSLFRKVQHVTTILDGKKLFKHFSFLSFSKILFQLHTDWNKFILLVSALMWMGKFFLPCFESIALELAMFFEYFLHASNIIRDVVVQKLVTF